MQMTTAAIRFLRELEVCIGKIAPHSILERTMLKLKLSSTYTLPAASLPYTI